MKSYLERARIARAIKAHVLNGTAVPTATRDKATKPNNGSNVARNGACAPDPGPRFPARRLEPAA